jgi:hypothetical protein
MPRGRPRKNKVLEAPEHPAGEKDMTIQEEATKAPEDLTALINKEFSVFERNRLKPAFLILGVAQYRAVRRLPFFGDNGKVQTVNGTVVVASRKMDGIELVEGPNTEAYRNE